MLQLSPGIFSLACPLRGTGNLAKDVCALPKTPEVRCKASDKLTSPSSTSSSTSRAFEVSVSSAMRSGCSLENSLAAALFVASKCYARLRMVSRSHCHSPNKLPKKQEVSILRCQNGLWARLRVPLCARSSMIFHTKLRIFYSCSPI